MNRTVLKRVRRILLLAALTAFLPALETRVALAAAPAESAADKARQTGTRQLADGDFAWSKYQRHVTGKNYEELWLLNQQRMGVDGRKAGYLIEAKWAGRDDAAWESSAYNPANDIYKTKGIRKRILEQAADLLRLDAAKRGEGVRYAVSNLRGKEHFEKLFHETFPKELASGRLRVWHVPGNGMK